MLTSESRPRIARQRAQRTRPARITVLDGSPEFVQLLQDVLESDGVLELDSLCTVTGYNQPVTLEQVIESRPSVLIIDPRFAAGTYGWELLGRAQADPALRDVPVIVCTFEDGQDGAPATTARGAFYVLSKPFALADLEAVLVATGL